MADVSLPEDMVPAAAAGRPIGASTELLKVEEALTIAWMFLNAVFVFLMQVRRQSSCTPHGIFRRITRLNVLLKGPVAHL